MPDIILASASPQRRFLLKDLGVPFAVDPSTVDERACAVTDPADRAVHLAQQKAQDVMSRHPGAVIIGCDTLVVSPMCALLEKPMDEQDAARMLREQSGGTSVVHSAVCVLDPEGGVHEGLSSSRVRFAQITAKDIAWWLGTGLWEGRSGAFQIDGPGQLMIEHIDGDWTGIVGLPVFLLGELLEAAGVTPKGPREIR